MSNKPLSAAEIATSSLAELARKRPELCDASGRAFWPVPAHFPHLLSRAVETLQQETTLRYLRHDPIAKELATVRTDLMKVVYEGDLGENHTDMFLRDHPEILSVTPEEADTLPFAEFCRGILSIDDPIVLLAVLTRNEEAGLAEAQALAQHSFIKPDGKFAKVHVIEEEVHGRISEGMRERLLRIPEFQTRFAKGEGLHDDLYRTILK